MLDKLKSIAKDAMWLSIGTVATVGYISYKAGKSIVDDVPEMMDFAQDTYSQVKDVLSKSKSEPVVDDVFSGNPDFQEY
tara:strand:+ start:324 stop:560 length:237 start_codon:yes stop_codon:yes gene_type:complete